MHIGPVLRQQRLLKGLTVTEAATLGGVTRSYLSMVETAQRAPNPELLVPFTRKLAMPTETWLPAFLADERRCSRLMRLGRALFASGDYVAARCALLRALRVSRESGDARYNSEIHMLLGQVCYAQGRYPPALRWFGRLERAIRHGTDKHTRAVVRYNVAQCMAKVGQELDALPRFDEAIAEFGQLGLTFELGKAWLAKANLLLSAKMHREARQAYRSAAYYLGGTPHSGDALLGCAICARVLDGAKASLPLLQEIVGISDSDPVLCAKVRVHIAIALREIGRFDEAVAEIDKSLAVRAELPSPLAASLLAEATLIHALRHDRAAAVHALSLYKAVQGPRDGQDIAAMRILARVLGAPPPEEELPRVVEEEHEHRLRDALRLLQDGGMREA